MLGEDFGATISGEVGSGLPQAGKLLDHGAAHWYR